MHGINCDPGHGFSVSEIAYTGAKLVRFAPWPDNDEKSRRFIAGCKELDIDVVLVLDKTAMTPLRSYAVSIRRLARKFPSVKFWQIGNEPDGSGDSSWVMSKTDFSSMLLAARQELRGNKYLIMGGLVGGDAGWLNGVDLRLVDAIAVHPYGRQPDNWGDPGWGFGKARELIAQYAVYNKPIWITEWGAQDELFHDALSRAIYHTEMMQTLNNCQSVEHSLCFCYSDRMVPGYGLIDENDVAKQAFAAFRDALVEP